MELFRKPMKNFKILILKLSVLFFSPVVKIVSADAVIDDGLNYLKLKQDATGRINTGFSAPSQWSAIAFAANGIDISTVKNPSVSLQDFLIGNIPSEPSAATDWETRILSIVAINGDPTNYGGVNYIAKLESFYINNQIGDECSLNDDIFGLLAEISAGTTSNPEIKQNVLNYLISKQDSLDGGFGFSAPGCAWYSTSADMTGAGIQVLVAAKQNGLTNPELDNAIDRAKNYLLTNQVTDGGYGYFGLSDSDTSGWVLMAFNVLDMQDSTPSAQIKNWLISQQSKDDGGFLAFDYGLNSSISNSTTTAQALIGLSGKSWILKIFEPSTFTSIPTLSITPTATPTNTLLSTPKSTLSPTSAPQPTSTPVSTATPTLTPIPTSSTEVLTEEDPTPTTGQILGTNKQMTVSNVISKKNFTLPIIFFGLGVLSLFIYKVII